MSKYDGCKIEVINWEKYNPRTDSKRPYWFRVDNTLATGEGFYGLDCEQKWLWIVILCLVSQKNGQPIGWNSKYIEAITGIKAKKQDETIEIYENFVRLRVSREVTSSNISDSCATRTLQDITIQDITKQNITKQNGHYSMSTAPGYEMLEKVWNANRSKLPSTKGMGQTRIAAANARWKEKPDPQYWTTIVRKMSESSFCRGETEARDGKKPWIATFDFLLRPETQFKVLEGKYDDRKQKEPEPFNHKAEFERLKKQAEEEYENNNSNPNS